MSTIMNVMGAIAILVIASLVWEITVIAVAIWGGISMIKDGEVLAGLGLLGAMALTAIVFAP